MRSLLVAVLTTFIVTGCAPSLRVPTMQSRTVGIDAFDFNRREELSANALGSRLDAWKSSSNEVTRVHDDKAQHRTIVEFRDGPFAQLQWWWRGAPEEYTSPRLAAAELLVLRERPPAGTVAEQVAALGLAGGAVKFYGVLWNRNLEGSARRWVFSATPSQNEGFIVEADGRISALVRWSLRADVAEFIDAKEDEKVTMLVLDPGKVAAYGARGPTFSARIDNFGFASIPGDPADPAAQEVRAAVATLSERAFSQRDVAIGRVNNAASAAAAAPADEAKQKALADIVKRFEAVHGAAAMPAISKSVQNAEAARKSYVDRKQAERQSLEALFKIKLPAKLEPSPEELAAVFRPAVDEAKARGQLGKAVHLLAAWGKLAAVPKPPTVNFSDVKKGPTPWDEARVLAQDAVLAIVPVFRTKSLGAMEVGSTPWDGALKPLLGVARKDQWDLVSAAQARGISAPTVALEVKNTLKYVEKVGGGTVRTDIVVDVPNDKLFAELAKDPELSRTMEELGITEREIGNFKFTEVQTWVEKRASGEYAKVTTADQYWQRKEEENKLYALQVNRKAALEKLQRRVGEIREKYGSETVKKSQGQTVVNAEGIVQTWSGKIAGTLSGPGFDSKAEISMEGRQFLNAFSNSDTGAQAKDESRSYEEVTRAFVIALEADANEQLKRHITNRIQERVSKLTPEAERADEERFLTHLLVQKDLALAAVPALSLAP